MVLDYGTNRWKFCFTAFQSHFSSLHQAKCDWTTTCIAVNRGRDQMCLLVAAVLCTLSPDNLVVFEIFSECMRPLYPQFSIVTYCIIAIYTSQHQEVPWYLRNVLWKSKVIKMTSVGYWLCPLFSTVLSSLHLTTAGSALECEKCCYESKGSQV